MLSNHQNLLPGVPLVESPFFEEMLGGGYLEPEDWRIACDLREQGYAVFDFPDPDFAAVSERLRTDMAGHFNIDGWRRGEVGSLRVQDAWAFNAEVRRIAANESVRRLLSRLYGREAFPFQTLSFPVGTQQHFHTDSVHFSTMPERFMCGVWVALEDIGLDQGPLLYYPGSHKWPIYTNEHIGHAHLAAGRTEQGVYEPFWRKLVAAHKVEPVRFAPKAGQALIWAANLLHGGDLHQNRSKTRWSQVTHYYFEDCCYYTPLMSDNPFGSVDFREPFNILTGLTVKNRYQGRPVPESYMANALPGRVATLWNEAVDRNPAPATRQTSGQSRFSTLLNGLSGSNHNAIPRDFDAAAYLAANPDVAAGGMTADDHYRKFGRKEGRRLRPD